MATITSLDVDILTDVLTVWYTRKDGEKRQAVASVLDRDVYTLHEDEEFLEQMREAIEFDDKCVY